MGKHRPETTHRVCGDVHTERRQITLEKSPDERLAPFHAFAVPAREERLRKSAVYPKAIRLLETHFPQSQTRQLVVCNAPRKRLGTLPEQIRSCAPQNEEPCADWFAIRQYTQYRKQLRAALHFIQHD